MAAREVHENANFNHIVFLLSLLPLRNKFALASMPISRPRPLAIRDSQNR